jgi:ribosomal protein S18 acetylase RimI-like enzyme
MAQDSSSSPQPELVIPTEADFAGIAALNYIAFIEKHGCDGKAETERNVRRAYNIYQAKYPEKLEHCRIIKSLKDGSVIAACQLQAKSDPGDGAFPSWMRHELRPGEVYVEWIACHPDHVGKGLGSRLLRWADSFAKETLNANILTLSVMKANAGAVRLYERKGFVVKPSHAGCLGGLLGSCFIFFLAGFHYWTILNMEKDLSKADGTPLAAPPDMDR